jgi:hypothetical protein
MCQVPCRAFCDPKNWLTPLQPPLGREALDLVAGGSCHLSLWMGMKSPALWPLGSPNRRKEPTASRGREGCHCRKRSRGKEAALPPWAHLYVSPGAEDRSKPAPGCTK